MIITEAEVKKTPITDAAMAECEGKSHEYARGYMEQTCKMIEHQLRHTESMAQHWKTCYYRAIDRIDDLSEEQP